MITLQQFQALDNNEKCNIINRTLRERGKKGFKGENIDFSWNAAEKILKECGIYEVDGLYRTADDTVKFLNEKKEKEKELVLTQDNIKALHKLLEPNRYEILFRLTEEYHFITRYILRGDRKIQIQYGDGVAHPMTMRVYDETKARWKAFVEANRNFSGAELLNTALIEFMDRYEQ